MWKESDSTGTSADPAVEAAELAELFQELSEAVDEFRLDEQIRHLTGRDQLVKLKFLGQKLDEQVGAFQTEETVELLAVTQPDLGRIKLLAVEAKVRIALLEDADRVIAIAVAGLSAGAAIVSGDAVLIESSTHQFSLAVVFRPAVQ